MFLCRQQKLYADILPRFVFVEHVSEVSVVHENDCEALSPCVLAYSYSRCQVHCKCFAQLAIFTNVQQNRGSVDGLHVRHINPSTYLTIVLGNNFEVQTLETINVKNMLITSYSPSAGADRFQTSLLLKLHGGVWTSTDQLHSPRHHAANIT